MRPHPHVHVHHYVSAIVLNVKLNPMLTPLILDGAICNENLVNVWVSSNSTNATVGVYFQEIEPRCGEALCKMFPPDNKLDISSIVRKARRSRHLVRPERPRDRPRNPRFNDMARLGPITLPQTSHSGGRGLT